MTQTREEVLLRVSRNGYELVTAPELLRSDREVSEAVVKPTFSLQPRSFQIVLSAVRKYGFALRVAAPQLQDDKEIVLLAVRQHGHALR